LSGNRGAEVRLIVPGFEELEIRVLPKDVDSGVAPLPTVPLNGVLLEPTEFVSKKCGPLECSVRSRSNEDRYVIEVDRWQCFRKQTRRDSTQAQTEDEYKRPTHSHWFV
jgi:hypothetical protein